MEFAVDKKTVSIAAAAIALVIVIAILFFFVFPGQKAGGTASPTPQASVTPSGAAGAAAPKNLDPANYKDSTASFIVELANAVKKMVD